MESVTSAPIDLARELNGLHQLLYMRGGIRPSNAAVDELTKLLLLKIAAEREPDAVVADDVRLGSVVDHIRFGNRDSIRLAKAAFRVANGLSSLVARLPNGEAQTVWPLDEPLRVSRHDVLSEALRILESIEFGTAGACDPLGAAFNVFLRGKYEHAGGLGTYLTPEGVVDLMVNVGFELLETSGPEGAGPHLMGDPCCGSGRFLVGLLHEARRRGIDERWLAGGRLLFGADQSASSVAMARVNLLAAGVPASEVFVVDDSITDRQVSQQCGRFSLILTNPPFGDKKYDSAEGIGRAARILPTLTGSARVDPALAFVARCVELLAPGGVAGIILPDGVGDGRAMRRLMLAEPRVELPVGVEGVVSLPPVTFAPAGTTAKTSVIFFRKSAPEARRHVFLARADHVGFVMSKGSPACDPQGDDLPRLTEGIRQLVAEPCSWQASPQLARRRLAELSSLDASTLDEAAELARSLLKDAGGFEARTVLRFGGKRRERLADGLPFVSVLHVDELGGVDWHLAGEHRPVTPGQLAEPGELLVSLLNPRKFRAAVVPESVGRIQCSAEFGVYRAEIDPYAALALLQHPLVRRQIAPLGRGTSSSRRRIDAADVLSLMLPPFDDASAARAGETAREHLESIARAASGLRRLYMDPCMCAPCEERDGPSEGIVGGKAGFADGYGTEHLPGFCSQCST